jgi:hypothetical protein
MAAIFGVILLSGACGAFWLLLPRNGKTHSLATAPYLGTIIPLAMVISVAVGVALVLLGVT